MYVLKKNPTVEWPVDISSAADGGKIEITNINVTFKLLNQDAYEAIKKNDIKLLTEVVVGWDGEAFGIETTDEGETAYMPFTPDNLQKILKFPNVRNGLIQGYWIALAGIEKN